MDGLLPGFEAGSQKILRTLVLYDGRFKTIDFVLPDPELPAPEHLV